MPDEPTHLVDMAQAAADWWVDRLDPKHGIPFGKEGSPLSPHEVEGYRRALKGLINENLQQHPDPDATARLGSLRVYDMIHTGLLADASEAADMSGLIYYLPRAHMALDLERWQISVDGEVIWKDGKRLNSAVVPFRRELSMGSR